MTNHHRFIMQPRNLAFLNHTAYNINDTMRNILQFAEDNPEHIPINFVDDVVSTLEEVKYYSHLEGDELIWEPIERRYVTLRHFFARWGFIERRPIIDYTDDELADGAESIDSGDDDNDMALDLDGETIDSEEERQLMDVVGVLCNFRTNRMFLRPVEVNNDPRIGEMIDIRDENNPVVREIIDLTDGDEYVIDLTDD